MTLKELLRGLTAIPVGDWDLPVKSGVIIDGKVQYIDCEQARLVAIAKGDNGNDREWIVTL